MNEVALGSNLYYAVPCLCVPVLRDRHPPPRNLSAERSSKVKVCGLVVGWDLPGNGTTLLNTMYVESFGSCRRGALARRTRLARR
jgi:hypothetical protein